MQGIQPDLALAIRSTPTPLDLGQKVGFAQRYWLARNPNHQDIYQQILPVNLRQPSARAEAAGPTAAVTTKMHTGTDIDELTARFARMEAHVANLFKKPYQPPRTSERSYNAKPEEKRNYDRYLTCYRCGEEGHMARNCQTETTRKATPSQRQQNRDGTYMMQTPSMVIREVYEDDDEEEEDVRYYPAIPGRKPGPKAKPYTRTTPARAKNPEVVITPKRKILKNEPEVIYEAPDFSQFDEPIKDQPMSESPARETPP
jgi:hypothetical protein